MIQENQKLFAAWIRSSGSGKDMDRLEIAYVETCSNEAEAQALTGGTLFAVRNPARAAEVELSLRNSPSFQQLNAAKNGRPLIALSRYQQFCTESSGMEIFPEPEEIWEALPGAEPRETERMPEAEADNPEPSEAADDIEDLPETTDEMEELPETTDDIEEQQETADDIEDLPETADIADEVPEEEYPEEIPLPAEDPASMEILFGTAEEDEMPVYWYPNDTSRLFHTNTGIIGTMGTGKTQFAKSLITQLYREQKNNFDNSPLGILIFDYKGDYNESKWDFRQATQAKVLKPYHLPFNPLAISRSNTFRPLLPSHTGNAFKDTIARTYHLGPKQQSALFKSIMYAYRQAGIIPDQAATWNRTAPTFAKVYESYCSLEDGGRGDSLMAAMEKLAGFEIFEPDPEKTRSLYDLLDGVVVIDLSGYDPDIQSLVVEMTLNLFYAQMHAAGSSRLQGKYRELRKMILVDEADHFMSEGYPSLKKILKEGREFGVGTILSTQFLKHFNSGEDDYAKYILTWVVHNVADLKPSDVDFVFRTQQNSAREKELYNEIRQLKEHHSIVKIATEEPVMICNMPFYRLIGED